jgi:SAM-dependent methyltransferase
MSKQEKPTIRNLLIKIYKSFLPPPTHTNIPLDLESKHYLIFDEAGYLAANLDVATAVEEGAYLNGYEHYVKYGYKESRVFIRTPSQVAEISDKILDQYVSDTPTEHSALAIFEGEWASQLPGYLHGGPVPLFEDDRIKWLESQCKGGFVGKKILELGPLEGGHTFMLSKAGAASIISIEGNKKAFLKCLLTKELFGYHAKFLLGDFTKYLKTTDERFEYLLASGVLYHMSDPISVLENMARVSNAIGIWTHYFDENIISANPSLERKFNFEPKQVIRNGRSYSYFEQSYLEALAWGGFCGGSAPTSNWMKKDDLLMVLKDLGYSVTLGADSLDHPNGPCILLYAAKI